MQNDEKTDKEQKQQQAEASPETDNTAGNIENTDDSAKSGNDVSSLTARNAELNDKYLRLYSEYDNYRKRTMREKAEIIKTAGEDVFKAILPIIDDFERAMKANEKQEDVEPVKEGVKLIYSKLTKAVQQKGLTSFDSVGQAFDPDIMEAITHISVEDKSQSGKVIDEVEKGYKLGDKVIRFAKVVVGQ